MIGAFILQLGIALSSKATAMGRALHSKKPANSQLLVLLFPFWVNKKTANNTIKNTVINSSKSKIFKGIVLFYHYIRRFSTFS
jgi:hypothetical protein